MLVLAFVVSWNIIRIRWNEAKLPSFWITEFAFSLSYLGTGGCHENTNPHFSTLPHFFYCGIIGGCESGFCEYFPPWLPSYSFSMKVFFWLKAITIPSFRFDWKFFRRKRGKIERAYCLLFFSWRKIIGGQNKQGFFIGWPESRYIPIRNVVGVWLEMSDASKPLAFLWGRYYGTILVLYLCTPYRDT